MRISETLRVVRGALLLVGLLAAPLTASALESNDPIAVYNSGVTALREHDFERALPAFEFSAQHGIFLAQYFEARLYGISDTSFTNHARAFDLLKRLVERNRDADPFYDRRAPYVAKAEVLIAYYLINGLPEAHIPADPQLGRSYLEHAAIVLGDKDAQFEFAKASLEDADSIERGLDQLANLAESKRHAPAAALLAELYSQGRFVQRLPDLALAYATLALTNAPEQDRLWISQVYQAIYCKTSQDDRERSQTALADLVQNAPKAAVAAKPARKSSIQGVLDLGEVQARRVCGNGEVVPSIASVNSASTDEPDNSVAMPVRRKTTIVGSIPLDELATPMGIGLKELETPQMLDSNGDPVDANSGDTPSQ